MQRAWTHSRRTPLLLLLCLCVAPAGCDDATDERSDRRVGRTPAPPPRVVLSAADQELWAPATPRPAVPVLRYQRVRPRSFARQMVLLQHAGYETITLEQFVRFTRGRERRLPARPLLLTVDGARLTSWTGSDGILRRLGFKATLFVNVGRVDARDPAYLRWSELNAMSRSGRWELQLQSGSGDHLIQYGSAPEKIGPFYAYRGSEERIDGWRERVFSDITEAERLLASRIPSYRPLAFAPPYGNYGQAGTNDPRIPRELEARLFSTFAIVFAEDGDGLATRGAGRSGPVGRIDVSPDLTDEDLHAALSGAP